MLTVLAPAKINLTLEVLAKRPDGFHEIRSVIQTINLCDSFHLQLSENIELKSSMSDWVSEASLVSKTIGLLQESTGCGKGAAVKIEKRIPLVSGLGGDSSDAAAILHGLNRLWELGLSQEELIGLARQLGSDVVFFFYGGTALLEGRGERVTPLPLLPHMWVVLMMPPMPSLQRKTERLYTSLKASHYTDGQITDRLVTQLAGGGGVTSSMVFNVFDKVALENFAGLEAYWQQFLQARAGEVHLAGSGPALFTLVKDKAEAERIHRHLQQQELESYLADTLPVIDKIG
ncbi:MAG: 4-(cytidine 5'-diphospho)-2-C-methyl-D-erythritol kinase [Dehalococcoidales bacterium]|nr:4-(cytidine 5'-diphospho)-2-C-methyl-D-erythritol kinase [Dehalococcoidales bacterium]|tara:strand:+ start:1041 stop:1907 length:867 start_codon:yes stop_codon:yes gene_type:complete